MSWQSSSSSIASSSISLSENPSFVSFLLPFLRGCSGMLWDALRCLRNAPGHIWKYFCDALINQMLMMELKLKDDKLQWNRNEYLYIEMNNQRRVLAVKFLFIWFWLQFSQRATGTEKTKLIRADLHTICKWDDDVGWHAVIVVANQLLATDTIMHLANDNYRNGRLQAVKPLITCTASFAYLWDCPQLPRQRPPIMDWPIRAAGGGVCALRRATTNQGAAGNWARYSNGFLPSAPPSTPVSGVSLPRSASLISGYSCRALSQQFGTYDVVTLTYGCFYFPSSLSLSPSPSPPFALIFLFLSPFCFLHFSSGFCPLGRSGFSSTFGSTYRGFFYRCSRPVGPRWRGLCSVDFGASLLPDFLNLAAWKYSQL